MPFDCTGTPPEVKIFHKADSATFAVSPLGPGARCGASVVVEVATTDIKFAVATTIHHHRRPVIALGAALGIRGSRSTPGYDQITAP